MFVNLNLCLWRYLVGITYLHKDSYFGFYGWGICVHLGPLCVMVLKRAKDPGPLGLDYWFCEECDL